MATSNARFLDQDQAHCVDVCTHNTQHASIHEISCVPAPPLTPPHPPHPTPPHPPTLTTPPPPTHPTAPPAGAFIATSNAVFLDQDDAHWADICAATHAREGLVSWARAEVERQRQGDLQCIVELCKEGLGRKLTGIMVTLLLDLLARRCLPVRSLAALWIESWPYRSNPVHMFKVGVSSRLMGCWVAGFGAVLGAMYMLAGDVGG